MKKWIKPLAIGVLVGSLSVPVIGVAASKMLHIEVTVVSPDFNIDGKVIKDDSYSNGENMLPYALNYKGSTYVPIRVLGELMGKKIGWDKNTGTIHIDSNNKGAGLNFEVVQNVSAADIPQDIKDWYQKTAKRETYGVKTVGDTNYILIQRGEKPTTGYSVGISGINELENQVVITADYTNPQPGLMQGQMISYPSMLVKTKSWDANKKVYFAMNQDLSIPSPDQSLVAGELKPSLKLDTSGKEGVHFYFNIKNQTEQVQNLTFENGLEYDYLVRSEQGQKIAVPKDEGIDQPHEKSLKQGEDLSYEGDIPLKPGKYTVDFYLNDRQWRSHQSQSFVVE